MQDMGYDAAGLREGAVGHEDVALSADRAATAFSRIHVAVGAFNRVTAAAGLATAVDLARERQGRAAAAEALARAELAARVRSVADMGDGLTATTTSVASSVRGSIVAGMQG